MDQKQYLSLDEVKAYLDSPEAKKDEKVLKDAEIAKTQLENLKATVPVVLQEKIHALKTGTLFGQLLELEKSVGGIGELMAKKSELEKTLKVELGKLSTSYPIDRTSIILDAFKPQILECEKQISLQEYLQQYKNESIIIREKCANAVQTTLVSKEGDEKPERTLTPEQAEQLLSTLETRFEANKERHKGVEWSKVKSSLEAKPEALWSLNEMEEEWHEPDVYFVDDKGFDVGTCCKESPVLNRSIVYDAEAREGNKYLRSAVELAEEMGIELMGSDKYKNELQAYGEYDLETWSWLKTSKEKRKTGVALAGGLLVDGVRVDEGNPSRRDDRGAFRGSLRVLWS